VCACVCVCVCEGSIMKSTKYCLKRMKVGWEVKEI
jgi:hypothetical protein